VPLRVYDQTIQVLKLAVQNAKLGREEELAALKRLDDQARLIEHHVRPYCRCADCRRTKSFTFLWRPERVRMGASSQRLRHRRQRDGHSGSGPISEREALKLLETE